MQFVIVAGSLADDANEEGETNWGIDRVGAQAGSLRWVARCIGDATIHQNSGTIVNVGGDCIIEEHTNSWYGRLWSLQMWWRDSLNEQDGKWLMQKSTPNRKHQERCRGDTPEMCGHANKTEMYWTRY